MSNNSMIEYKESFISKIKNFFKNLFKNKKEQKDYVPETTELKEKTTVSIQNGMGFFDDIKVDSADIDKFMDKDNFLKYIDGNVEALNLLSVDRLSKLKEYYDGVIEKNDKIIKQLKEDN